MFFQDVVKYSSEESDTVTGLIDGSGVFETSCESSGGPVSMLGQVLDPCPVLMCQSLQV